MRHTMELYAQIGLVCCSADGAPWLRDACSDWPTIPLRPDGKTEPLLAGAVWD